MPNLDLFFNPRAIAVVGASRTPGKIGYTILENLKMTYKGKIYPINLEATEIMGLNAYPSVLNIEEPVDLAVIAVPAEKVKYVVLECIKKKIKACCIISSGFSEIGQKEREIELQKISKGKIDIIGPNCLGVYSKNLDMLFLSRDRFKRPSEGNISFISQSGAVGSALIDMIGFEGIGISRFISYGNALDIGEIELIDYLGKDTGTRAIAMYIENIKDGLEFIKVASKVSKIKPLVALKAGKTKKGQEACMSHTGALAGPANVYSSAFKQAGVIEAKTSEELFDMAKSLAYQPIMADNKIAVITDGGGFGVLAADAAVEFGLELPALTPESLKPLRSAMPAHGITANPVDVTGDASDERFKRVLDIVFRDRNISGVIAIVLPQIPALTEGIVDILRDCKLYGKPYVVCMSGGAWTQEKARKLESFGVPVYPTPERAAKALAALYEYGKIVKGK